MFVPIGQVKRGFCKGLLPILKSQSDFTPVSIEEILEVLLERVSPSRKLPLDLKLRVLRPRLVVLW